MAKSMARDAPSTEHTPLTAQAHATPPSDRARRRRPRGNGRPMATPRTPIPVRATITRRIKGKEDRISAVDDDMARMMERPATARQAEEAHRSAFRSDNSLPKPEKTRRVPNVAAAAYTGCPRIRESRWITTISTRMKPSPIPPKYMAGRSTGTLTGAPPRPRTRTGSAMRSSARTPLWMNMASTPRYPHSAKGSQSPRSPTKKAGMDRRRRNRPKYGRSSVEGPT